MNTIGWIFILIAFVLIRMGWKGQVIDESGKVVVFDNLSNLWIGFVTNDSKLIKETLNSTSAGLNTPTVDSGAGNSAATGGAWAFGLPDSATPKEWDTLNPKTVDDAVEWALTRNTFPTGMCERMVTLAYGHNSGFPTAKAHADAMTLRSGTPPRGALVFHATKNPAQHVCLSIGGGYVVSTDFDGHKFASGVMKSGPIENIDKWGPRRGWSPPIFK